MKARLSVIAVLAFCLTLWGGADATGSGTEPGGDCGIDCMGPDRQPIIFWRILQEDRQAVAALLDAGYDIERKGGFGMTPLIQAAMIDDWITAELLLSRGADPWAVDRRGFTAAHRAATSRVDPGSAYGLALLRVRAELERRGVEPSAPATVKAMQAAGKWPPMR